MQSFSSFIGKLLKLNVKILLKIWKSKEYLTWLFESNKNIFWNQLNWTEQAAGDSWQWMAIRLPPPLSSVLSVSFLILTQSKSRRNFASNCRRLDLKKGPLFQLSTILPYVLSHHLIIKKYYAPQPGSIKGVQYTHWYSV